MTPSQLKKVLNQNWGDDWLKHFKHFDVRPFAAASIGQVHRASLKSGEVVAIKGSISWS
jgi:predicted unusual protein kinase regulating ubiquinone biosynthesis (AarF/ABC1/UbiB family)